MCTPGEGNINGSFPQTVLIKIKEEKVGGAGSLQAEAAEQEARGRGAERSRPERPLAPHSLTGWPVVGIMGSMHGGADTDWIPFKFQHPPSPSCIA